MGTINENSQWVERIYSLDEDTPVVGGEVTWSSVSGQPLSGFSNAPIQQLANRTLFTRDAVNALTDVVTGQGETVTGIMERINNHIGEGGDAHALASTSLAGFMSAEDKDKLDGLALVATSGSYTDLINRPGNATNTTNGFMSSADKVKLDGIATGATNNATNAQLRDRSTHTGTQTISTVNGLQAALDAKVANASIGQPNGVAPLDSGGLIPSTYLPSYVEDVIEVENIADLPNPGEAGKIYLTIDTHLIYRWSGSTYVEINPSPGSTDAVPEGSANLYFTQARVRATPLAGLTIPASAAITASDSILVAAGKLQAQINGKANTSHTHAATDITSGTLPNLRLPSRLQEVTSFVTADLNTLAHNGFYYVSSAGSNLPVAQNGHLFVQSYSSGAYVVQYFTPFDSNRVFTRVKNNTTWLPWGENWNSVNLTISSASTADAVVQRGTAGEITGSRVITTFATPTDANFDLESSWPNGIYSVQGSTTTGHPTLQGIVLTVKESNVRGAQFVIAAGGSGGSGIIRFRRFHTSFTNGVGPWVTGWSDNNMGAGSGLDADTVDGMQPSNTWNAPNTLVTRDGSGNIAANRANFSALQLTASTAARNTDTIFYSSVDSNVYKNTAAGFKTSLGLANVASSGSYNDLTDRPVIPPGTAAMTEPEALAGTDTTPKSISADILKKAAQQHGGVSSLATIATTGSADNLVAGTIPEARLPRRLRASSQSATPLVTNWDDATENGWYSASNTLNAPGGDTNWWNVFVENHNNNFVQQTATQFNASPSSTDTKVWRRYKNNGTWNSWFRLRFGEGELDARYLGISATAASATQLATARTISGVSFNGTANITIPWSGIGSRPSVVTQAEAEAGTATTERMWTAQRVAQAIAALAAPKTMASTTVDGLMSSADKTKLDGIGTNANGNKTISTSAPSGTANQGDIWYQV